MSNGHDANAIIVQQYDNALERVEHAPATDCPSHKPLQDIVVVMAIDMRSRRAGELERSRTSKRDWRGLVFSLLTSGFKWAAAIGAATLIACKYAGK